MTRLSSGKIILLATLLAAVAASYMRPKGGPGLSSLSVFVSEPPNSIDPLDYNLFKNFPLQSLVNIKLFSNYKDATLSGQLVKSWSSERSNTLWRFHLRDDVTFSDGVPVKVTDAVASLKRIFYVMKVRKSHNDLADALIDIENLESASTPGFRGIRAEGDSLVVELKKPYPKMMEVLGFGLYSVVRPSYFDPKTGSWIGKYDTSYVGAGPYVVESISSTLHVLKKRMNYPADLIHASAFERIEMAFDLESSAKADIRGGAGDLQTVSPQWTFHSAGSPYIAYAICHSWKLKAGACNDKQFRISLREALISAAEKRGVKTSRSFFPLTISGVAAPAALQNVKAKKFGREFTFNDYRKETKSKTSITLLDAVEEAVAQNTEKAIGVSMPWDDMRKNINPDLPRYTIDLALYSTDITPYDPEGDIRFMFSNEGVRLPDATGEIRKELSKDNFSIQKVNELLYEQAIVWPITHITYGIWASPRLDFSRYGFLLPLAELQWIGQK